MLSPTEQAAFLRGQTLKRNIRAAAALAGIYDDSALGDAVGVGRNTVGGWWLGAKPSAPTILRLSKATGLSTDALARFIHEDGPPPVLPEDLWQSGSEGIRDALRQERERQAPRAPGTPDESPSQWRPDDERGS